MNMESLVKTVSGAAVFAASYITHQFGVAFWILAVLAITDVFLVKKGDAKEHFFKMGSMLGALGVPSLISANINNIGDPNFLKLLVCLLCIMYIRNLYPRVVDLISKTQISSDPVQNQLSQAEIEQLLQLAEKRAEDKLNQKALEETKSLQEASTHGTELTK